MLDFPTSPTVGQKYTGPGGQVWVWNGTAWDGGASALPGSINQVPIVFYYGDKPKANGAIAVPVAIPLTIPANLTGAVATLQTPPTAAASFTLQLSTGSGSSTIGTISFAANANTATFSGPGGSVAAGDTLWMGAPGTQDATLADVGITILAQRV